MDLPGALHCRACAADHPLDPRLHQCPSCLGPLSYHGSERAFPADLIADRPAHMWRYAEALPGFSDPVSLGEAVTPLVPLRIGPHRALAKCDYLLPSGSYKDRGAACLVSYLKEAGVKAAVEDSSGNAGAALAAYAARGGVSLKVFCPSSAAAGKLAQIGLYGADLVPVEGARPRATEALLDYIGNSNTVYASHLWQPLFLEGLRTMAYEIAEQLGWAAPDLILCPVGAGSILLGLHWGFQDLLAAGVIDRLPRLVAVQAAAIAPVATALRNGATSVEPVHQGRPTLAEGIALPAPVRGAEVMAALHQTEGAAVTVTEDEIADGLRSLGRAGFCVEPTSAVVWHGLLRYAETHALTADATVVLVLSGHGLKAGAQLGEVLATF